jgi:hypothetical protein
MGGHRRDTACHRPALTGALFAHITPNEHASSDWGRSLPLDLGRLLGLDSGLARVLPRPAPVPGSTREANDQPVISILCGLAASDLGTVTVSTPSESCAVTASALTSPGR